MVPMHALRARFQSKQGSCQEQNGACAHAPNAAAPSSDEHAVQPPRRQPLQLLHGRAYRVITTLSRVFDRVYFDAPRLAFLLGPGVRGGEPKALPLDAIERVALSSGGASRAGGERFVPIGECFAEPLTLAGAQ